MKGLNKVALGLWAAVAVVGLGAVSWVWVLEPRLNQSVASVLGRGDYELVTTDGSVFTEATLKGSPSAVFFGFTHCPEVCPTTLGDIAVWQDILQEEGQDPLRTYFVTVDPKRDTPEMLADYVSWAPGVIGVSGSQEEIDKAIRAFRIYAREVPLDNGGYTMDHSAMVLLFDENGNLFEPIGYQEGTERAISKIRRLLNS